MIEPVVSKGAAMPDVIAAEAREALARPIAKTSNRRSLFPRVSALALIGAAILIAADIDRTAGLGAAHPWVDLRIRPARHQHHLALDQNHSD